MKKLGKNKSLMESSSKKRLFIILGTILLLLIVIILVIYLTNNSKKDKNPKEEEKIIANTNEGVIQDQEIDGLSLTQTSLVYQNGISTLKTLVTNTSNESYYLEEFQIIVKDEQGNNIINYTDEEGNIINYLVGYAGVEIPPKGSTTIDTSIDFDISSSAYTISYKVVK